MRVLGIDPGTIKMGYGIVDDSPRISVDDYGVVALPRGMVIEQRLYQLHTHVLNMIHTFNPDCIAVEQPFVGSGTRQFVGPALALGQAQALVLIGAASQGVPVYRYSPAEIKSAVTDYGAASKQQVQDVVAMTLGLIEIPPSDAADALAIGLCHLNHRSSDLLISREIKPGDER